MRKSILFDSEFDSTHGKELANFLWLFYMVENSVKTGFGHLPLLFDFHL